MTTYCLYDATITPAKAALTSLKRILTIAEPYNHTTNLLTARLHADMKPLSFQVQYSTAQASKMASQLSGQPPPALDEDFLSFADMYTRIDSVLGLLNAVDKDAVSNFGEMLVPAPVGDDVLEFPARVVATVAIMPNIYFHVSMAYAILRKEGVPLGKRDYLRSFVSDYVKRD